jgi:nitroimidazol reductase NimA-like FMN-containing flavoprotein (pyridoxamine 5'-phosphate oxidase superfamily)
MEDFGRMFNMAKYHMYKKEREIKDKEELIEILKQGKYAVMSMCRNNEPYAVTLSYGYDKDKNSLYFHTAAKGLKIDFIKQNPRVCATIINDKGYVMNECDHKFRSIVFWGEMYVVQDSEEKKHGMEILLNHLEDNPRELKEKFLKNDETFKKTTLLRLDIKKLTGKSNITKK